MYKKILFIIIFIIASFSVNAQESVPLTTDSRIRTIVYNPNEVYQLKFHYGFQSFIEFAPDEDIDFLHNATPLVKHFIANAIVAVAFSHFIT